MLLSSFKLLNPRGKDARRWPIDVLLFYLFFLELLLKKKQNKERSELLLKKEAKRHAIILLFYEILFKKRIKNKMKFFSKKNQKVAFGSHYLLLFVRFSKIIAPFSRLRLLHYAIILHFSKKNLIRKRWP